MILVSTIVEARGEAFTVLAINADPEGPNFFPVLAVPTLILGTLMLAYKIYAPVRHERYAREREGIQNSRYRVVPRVDWVHSALGLEFSLQFGKKT